MRSIEHSMAQGQLNEIQRESIKAGRTTNEWIASNSHFSERGLLGRSSRDSAARSEILQGL
jgi:hypothetical protein